MSKKYTQLTAAERYPICAMKKLGFSNAAIAGSMGRNRSTIGRELPRNTGPRGYRPQQAQRRARARHRAKPKRVKLTVALQASIRRQLAQHWRPAQLAGRWR